MKIHFMMAYARDKGDVPILDRVIANLRAEGFEVSVGPAEPQATSFDELAASADLYVLKSKHPTWLTVARELFDRGARLLNSYPASITTLNKISAAPVLEAAGVPVPRSWPATRSSYIEPGTSPLIVKPSIGHGSAGIRIVQNSSEVLDLNLGVEGMLIQEFISPVEDELKLYVVGKRVFGIRKHAKSGVGEPVPVEPPLEKIALHCGRALGLEIYGVDVLLTKRGPYVIDVNYFPSFRGVAEAAASLSAYIGAVSIGR